MTKATTLVMILAALAARGARAGDAPPAPSGSAVPDGARVLSVGGVLETFVPVKGMSLLPLEYMRAGTNREDLSVVVMPDYWIARRDVTEGAFAEVTGRAVREGRAAEDPATGIEWIEAVRFCEKLNARVPAGVPRGYRFEIPTMLEWAHAVKALERDAKEQGLARPACDLGAGVGKMLFVGGLDGGFLYTLGRDAVPAETAAGRDVAFDFLCMNKHWRRDDIGFRLALVPDDAAPAAEDGAHTMTTRGVVLLEAGYLEEARRYLARAAAQTGLTERQRERLDQARARAARDREYRMEDWDGLVSSAAEAVRARGYAPDGIFEAWAARAPYAAGPARDAEAVAAYRRAGVAGMLMPIGDLPVEVRHDQPLGAPYTLLLPDGEELFAYETRVTERTEVEMLSCDFTGDGLNDLVVEIAASFVPTGAAYRLYARTDYGRYKSLGEPVVCAGLCAVPRREGGPCAFVVVEKRSNPILGLALLDCAEGELRRRELDGKPFLMLDAREDQVYLPAPFIGGGYGLGWRHLEGRGRWYRPLFWPWKPGAVPGFADAVEARAARRAE